MLAKALNWSRAVNAAIVELDESLKVPYDGAREGLAAAHAFADVAMVSSANRDAVEEEWGKFGLLEHTDIVLAQDVGSKAACIREMLKFGYDVDKVVISDEAGDQRAPESQEADHLCGRRRTLKRRQRRTPHIRGEQRYSGGLHDDGPGKCRSPGTFDGKRGWRHRW